MTPSRRIPNNLQEILSVVPRTYRCSKMVALHGVSSRELEMRESEVSAEEGGNHAERLRKEVTLEPTSKPRREVAWRGVEQEGVRSFWWEAGRNGPNRCGGGSVCASQPGRTHSRCTCENAA